MKWRRYPPIIDRNQSLLLIPDEIVCELSTVYSEKNASECGREGEREGGHNLVHTEAESESECCLHLYSRPVKWRLSKEMDLSESNFSRKDIFKSHQEEENKRERNQPAQNWFTCPYLWGTRRIEGISLLYLHSLELQVFEFFHEEVRPPTTASLAATVLVHHYELTRSCWKLIVNFYSFLCFSVSVCVFLASCFLCLCQFTNLTYSFAFAVATTLQIMMLL